MIQIPDSTRYKFRKQIIREPIYLNFDIEHQKSLLLDYQTKNKKIQSKRYQSYADEHIMNFRRSQSRNHSQQGSAIQRQQNKVVQDKQLKMSHTFEMPFCNQQYNKQEPIQDPRILTTTYNNFRFDIFKRSNSRNNSMQESKQLKKDKLDRILTKLQNFPSRRNSDAFTYQSREGIHLFKNNFIQNVIKN